MEFTSRIKKQVLMAIDEIKIIEIERNFYF